MSITRWSDNVSKSTGKAAVEAAIRELLCLAARIGPVLVRTKPCRTSFLPQIFAAFSPVPCEFTDLRAHSPVDHALTTWSDCVLISPAGREKLPIQGTGGHALAVGELGRSRGLRPTKETPVLIQGLAAAGGNGKGDGQEERGT